MLDIRPFEYGLQMVAFYEEGSTNDASIIETDHNVVLSKFFVGIANVASLSMGLNFPSMASLPHVVMNGFKNLISIALGTEYDFEKALIFKQMVENPGAFASDQAPVESSAGGESSATNPEPEAPPQEEEEEEDGLEFDLFG